MKKKYAKGIELRGKTLGIIGFGRIGQNTAKYALGAGMNILAYDPYMEKASIEINIAAQKIEVNIDTTSMEELLCNSDFISLHVPMPKDGNAIIGSNEIEKMKDGVRIVNAARGGVIDEKALISALDSNKVSFAALDVFVGEPKPSKELLKNKKISLTPHIGAATLEAQDRIGEELAEKIINFYKK
ncbi:MAG: NAD(P)-dependent oxidoreductase [Flavobacteriales bacterium]|nr:NAD(P)-dependent oxidoreductase [Flavobacteriales bacterium]